MSIPLEMIMTDQLQELASREPKDLGTVNLNIQEAATPTDSLAKIANRHLAAKGPKVGLLVLHPPANLALLGFAKLSYLPEDKLVAQWEVIKQATYLPAHLVTLRTYDSKVKDDIIQRWQMEIDQKLTECAKLVIRAGQQNTPQHTQG